MPINGQGSLIQLLGFVRSANLAAVADTAIALAPPSPGSWGLCALMAYNASTTPTSQNGSFFTATGGGGTNLGALNLASLTTGSARGLFPLAISPVGATTIYYRTTIISSVAATCDLAVYGILMP